LIVDVVLYIFSHNQSEIYIYIYILSHNNQSDYLCPCSGAGFLSRVRTSASQAETWAPKLGTWAPKLPDRPVVTYYKRKSFSVTAAEFVARDPSAWPIREQKRRGERRTKYAAVLDSIAVRRRRWWWRTVTELRVVRAVVPYDRVSVQFVGRRRRGAPTIEEVGRGGGKVVW
jgi:hypothetical protein